jgi:hypothetical protein
MMAIFKSSNKVAKQFLEGQEELKEEERINSDVDSLLEKYRESQKYLLSCSALDWAASNSKDVKDYELVNLEDVIGQGYGEGFAKDYLKKWEEAWRKNDAITEEKMKQVFPGFLHYDTNLDCPNTTRRLIYGKLKFMEHAKSLDAEVVVAFNIGEAYANNVLVFYGTALVLKNKKKELEGIVKVDDMKYDKVGKSEK